MTTNERFDRQIRFFGKDGQKKISSSKVAVIGLGGTGSHVVQQLAFLGVGKISLIDEEELAITDLNRNVCAIHDDPIPGTRKVDIGERRIKEINPIIEVVKIPESVVSQKGFDAVINSDYAFGCVDHEGIRLILTELCSAYSRPYIDIASDVLPGETIEYGGRVCVSTERNGCLVCLDVLDLEEASEDLANPNERKDREALYGVGNELLDRSGPSVVSLNGVVSSLAVTEFMVMVTGLREPVRVQNYHGNTGKVAVNSSKPAEDCYYCRSIRGKGDAADVQRYLNTTIGKERRQ